MSLRKEIRIGILSVATLLTATPHSSSAKIAISSVDKSDSTEFSAELLSDDLPPLDINLLEEGDLLFNVVANRSDELSNAIAEVTEGIDLHSISHVAIVCEQKGKMFALEASRKHGVWLNPIDSFICQTDTTPDGRPMILVGRLKDRSNIKYSIRKALYYLGRPYDYLYMPDDREIYCSELVQLSFTDRQGHSIFPVEPMSFHDSAGHITDYWIDYYKRFGINVPEGKPGTNPGGISRSKAIDIIFRY